MNVKIRCPVCGNTFGEREKFMDHVIDKHWGELKEVLEKERSGKCHWCPPSDKYKYSPTELYPWSMCPHGHHIGSWAYRRIAGAWATIYSEEANAISQAT